MRRKIWGGIALVTAGLAAWSWNSVFGGSAEAFLNAIFWGGASVMSCYMAITAEMPLVEDYSQ